MQPLFWLETLTGWLITTLALSLGAPFWFDTLNKFMVVRSTVKPKEKSKDGRSKGLVRTSRRAGVFEPNQTVMPSGQLRSSAHPVAPTRRLLHHLLATRRG